MNLQAMERIDDNSALYIVLAVLLAALLALTVSFILAEKSQERYKKELSDQSNSVRVFIIDIPNNSVKYFNASDLGNVRSFSLGNFYAQFPVSEQRKVIQWINAVADAKSDSPDYLECDVTVHHQRKQYFSLLQVEHVNYKTQVIHLQSFLLKYMTAGGKGRNADHGLSNAKQLSAAITASGRKGITACYRFQYRKIQDKDKEIEPIIFSQLKNALAPLLDGKRYLICASGNELLLSDVRISDRPKALFLVKSGLTSINRYLSLNGYTSLLETKVGVVWHRRLYDDGESVIEQARKTAQFAFDTKEPILFYEKGRESLSSLNDASYRTEVERIINEKKLNYYFRPIYSVKEERTIGYLTKAEPKETYFDNIEELKDYASRTGDGESLFSTIARNTLPIFVNERLDDSQSLFFPVRMEDQGYMLLTFGRLSKAKQAHIIFLFNETDVRGHLPKENPEVIIQDMKAIRAKGYQVALLLNEGELGLPSTVYPAFDYFVCGFRFAGSANEMDAKVRSQLHALPEKLLKYNKPIIATDIEGWASIGLIVNSKIEFISSESFAPYDPMIMPLPPKSVKKVKDMTRG